MQIIQYPHPTLRHRSKPVRRIDAALRDVAQEMFDRMYEASGVGLAANQVDLPLRLFVVNEAGRKGEGRELVFVNPVLSKPKGTAEKEEGCLSLPGLYADVKRPESVHLSAFDLAGNEIEADLNGMLARIVQHETDHLDGVLFVDRLSTTGEMAVKEALEEFEIHFRSKRETGGIPSDEAIARRLREWEAKYC